MKVWNVLLIFGIFASLATAFGCSGGGGADDAEINKDVVKQEELPEGTDHGGPAESQSTAPPEGM